MALDFYNECARCGKTKGAPWNAEDCKFEVYGFKRVVPLCSECREWTVEQLKKMLKPLPKEEKVV